MINICHASDSPENGEIEVKRFFKPEEIFATENPPVPENAGFTMVRFYANLAHESDALSDSARMDSSHTAPIRPLNHRARIEPATLDDHPASSI